MINDLDEALALMRRALELLDRHDDPCVAAPHLDLAIRRIEDWPTARSRRGARDGQNGSSLN